MGLINGLGLVVAILGLLLYVPEQPAWQIGCNVVVMTLGATVAAFGVKGCRLTFNALMLALLQKPRDSNDTLASLLMLCELSRKTGMQALGAVRSNWAVMRRVCHLIAKAADERVIQEEASHRVLLAARHYSDSQMRLRWLMVFCFCAGLLGALFWSGEELIHPSWLLFGALGSSLFAVLSARVAHLANIERDNIQLAFQGASCILRSNSSERVYQELSSLFPQGGLRSYQELRRPQPSA